MNEFLLSCSPTFYEAIWAVTKIIKCNGINVVGNFMYKQNTFILLGISFGFEKWCTLCLLFVIFALPYGFLYSRKLTLDLECVVYRGKLYSSTWLPFGVSRHMWYSIVNRIWYKEKTRHSHLWWCQFITWQSRYKTHCLLFSFLPALSPSPSINVIPME